MNAEAPARNLEHDLADWLDAIAASRDFTLVPSFAPVDARDEALVAAAVLLVERCAAELRRFRAAVDDAGDAIARNTEQLAHARAKVRIPAGLLPKSGSVSPKHPIASPRAMRGSHARFCSSDPQR